MGAKSHGVNREGLRYVNRRWSTTRRKFESLAVMFDLASERRCLHNIHKSNVLLSSELWNEVLREVAQNYPNVEVTHMLADAAATEMCLAPNTFDVMVMENMFGDILSDQAGGLWGHWDLCRPLALVTTNLILSRHMGQRQV